MQNLECKKLLILRILSILEDYTDISHPLTHQEIIDKLSINYNADCERKAIARNITYLKDAGYPIASTRKGVYLESRLFETSELRLLIDSVLASRHINEAHSIKLIDKLLSLSNVHFNKYHKHVKVSDWGKSGNVSFFLNVETIDEAIENGKQISFNYAYYDIDKKLNIKKDTEYIINPYQMILNNQRYYLIANMDKYDNLTYYRIDRILNIKILTTPIKPITSLFGHEKGLHLASIACEHPYMFTGPLEYIVMSLNRTLIGDIIDWFGDKFKIIKHDNETVTIRLKANLNAMRYWALQYGLRVEILEPSSLRETIIEDISGIYHKYNLDK